MSENEFKKLLDREKHKKVIKQYFSSQTNLLIDMVNYGSWLIPRAYHSSNKNLEDVIVIGVLLKQVITMIDSVEVLVSNGTVYPAFLQARAALEASLYIDWILKEDANKKAKYYYVSNLRNERFWALSIIKGTSQQQKFANDIQDLADYVDLKSSGVQEIARKQLSEVNRILEQESFRQIDLEFEEFYKKRNREPYWYQLLLRGSLGRIAKEVGRSSEYVYFYEKGSKVTHAASYRDHIKFSRGGKFDFEPIRNLSEIDTLLKYAIGIALHAYQSIIRYYRHGEISNFKCKYKADWQQPFLNIPSVDYKSD